MRPYLWMLCGCAWFSAMGLLAHALAPVCEWQLVAGVRSTLAAAFAAAMLVASGARFAVLRPRVLWIRSLAGSGSLLATFYALTHLPVSDALTLTNTFPLWVALLAWPLSGSRPTLGVGLAALCAVVGVAVVERADFAGFGRAHAAAIVASVFTAVAMLGLNRLKGVGSLAVVVHFSTISALTCVVAYFLGPRETGFTRMQPADWVTLLGVGITATAGQVCLTKAFRSGPATHVSVVGLAQVVMVMVWEGAIDDRTFTPWQLAGTALVLGPSAYLMLRERKRGEPPVKPDEAPAEEAVVE